jgi:hypothetical protein
MSTLKVTSIQNPSTSSGGVSIDTSGHVTVDGVVMPSAGPLGNRNLIINGAMDVTQRGTASVTATGQYPVDRFVTSFSVSSAAISSEVQEEAPAGFFRSLRYRMTTAATAGAAEVNNIQHKIEGFNIRHLNWGSANAQNVTLSFWVRSSNAGTYCVSLRNDAGETRRSYVAEYTIQAADTWERITILIDGDTSGTWLTGAGLGVNITWDLGSGSNFNGTADSWLNNENRINTSNQFNFAGTTDAAFYLTGVQLEAGDVATPFEHRSYGDELARCQRYFQRLEPELDMAVVRVVSNDRLRRGTVYCVVRMRAIPTTQNLLFFNTSSTSEETVTVDAARFAAQASGVTGISRIVEIDLDAEL